MELDHAIIRILAAIERERDHPAEEEERQSFGHDIRTSIWEEADDVAARVLGLRLVGALP